MSWSSPAPAASSTAGSDGLHNALWRSGVWLLMVFEFIIAFGTTVDSSFLATLTTNGFASAAAGHPVDCAAFPTSHVPDFCGRVGIFWYFPALAVGGLVSALGMVFTSVADLIEPRHRAAAYAYVTSCYSLGGLAGSIAGPHLTTASAVWTASCVSCLNLVFVALAVRESAPRARLAAARCRAAAATAMGGSAPAEAFVAAATAVGPAPGAPCAAPDGAEPTAAAGAGSSEAAALLQEGPLGPPQQACTHTAGEKEAHARLSGGSAVVEATASAKGPGPGPSVGLGARMWVGLVTGRAVICRSPYYRRIALIWVVMCLAREGADGLQSQYTQLTMGFTPSDQAHLIDVISIGSLVVRLGLLPLLVAALGERRLLAWGLGAYALECLGMAAAPAYGKAAALAAVGVGALSSVCWPALVAMQTAGVERGRQGAVFGAMEAVSALASGLGPLGFAYVFSAFTRTESRLPHAPFVVWLLAAVLTAAAMVLTFSMPERAPERGPADAAEDELNRSAGEGLLSGREEAPKREEPTAGLGTCGGDVEARGGGLTQPLLGGGQDGGEAGQ
ncbi:hypothetical protein HYH03_004489 [Edaphochlamys debaryana]|uniref:Major facilitator superfamily (MFS) profile domain-containing protein n=1 Tax=Edaphochlamys debaryana TaxID=47281 RepID=A0A835Y8Z1_9CHLO|nr:hypothetical protein HYH03_004489 [Edaphochlamys debaryana]|eukprot:KAG2497324.1 hypothetical protein HYH03_004489 [Edaphochlamys debaryana]